MLLMSEIILSQVMGIKTTQAVVNEKRKVSGVGRNQSLLGQNLKSRKHRTTKSTDNLWDCGTYIWLCIERGRARRRPRISIEVGIQYKISVKTGYPGNPFQRTWPRESTRVCAPLILPEVATNYHLPACHNFTVALLARAFDCDPTEMTSQQR